MTKVIGIDIGGSTTKIIGLSDNKIFNPMIVKATDPIASVYGALGKFLSSSKLQLNDICRIMITGAGSSFVSKRLFDIPTGKIDEFKAIGKGGLFLSQLEKAVIVSMGTGTALVSADKISSRHLGGTGIGGGTLLGLSNKILNVRNFNDVMKTAEGGSLKNVDLSIGDIIGDSLEGFPADITASNFGKISDLASSSDMALGIINLVFESIGMLSVFATKIENTKDVVLTGNLTNVPQARDIFNKIEQLYTVNFHIPNYAEYATAVGAAISYNEITQFNEI